MARPREFNAEVVLDKAAEAFRSKGYDGTSVDDLEKATGLGRASLYGAYGDKRALYLAALRRYDGVRAVRLLEELGEARTGKTALKRLFDAVLDEAAGDPCGCLIAGAASERAAHDAAVARCVEDNRRRLEGALLAALLRGRADGSLKPRGEARAAARFLFAAVLGIRALAKSGGARDELAQIARTALAAAS
jgi:TetR/AcrR family transcriptional repressor of nem operon